MKVSDTLRIRESGYAFEFFPPKTDTAKEAFVATVDVLKKFNPLYMTMTYGASGKTRETTKEAVDILLRNKSIETVPHLTCVGLRKAEIKAMLDDYKRKGIENIMALRGDPPECAAGFDFKAQELSYAVDLVKFIKQNYNFCVGVAVYPEGHVESKSLDKDFELTCKKIETGADFAVTQMFFDNNLYYAYLEKLRKCKIEIPVLPGILPLTDVAKIKKMASVCRVMIPRRIEEKMERLRNDPVEMGRVGLDFTIKQCQDLIKHGVKKIHFFTLNQPVVIKRIIDSLQ
jgi:methylenetetrahydrofolate reductase (NADPH)